MTHAPASVDPGDLVEVGAASVNRAVPFGMYVHVPFCASRCGYCAFTTYTSAELGGDSPRRRYPAAACAEVGLARAAFGAIAPVVSTVFFGGGTPTLLDAAELASIIDAIRSRFVMAHDVEITVEANPDSVDAAKLDALRAAGVTRISFGMQSVKTHVLAILERSHTPGAATDAVAMAHAVGFDHVSLDLIYGTPGESEADWHATLEAAIGANPDHLSAYALAIEPKTRLAAQVRRGSLPRPDDDLLADRYEHADEMLSAAGYGWYEISNWARTPKGRCRHNLLYWHNHNWWGVGPGAHGHLGDRRWSNDVSPQRYVDALSTGRLAVADVEILTADEQALEQALVGVRLADGFHVHGADQVVAELVDDGLVSLLQHGDRPRLGLSRRGRLLADLVARRVTDAGGTIRGDIAAVTHS